MIAGHENASFPSPRQAGAGGPVRSTSATATGSASENESTGAAYTGMSDIKAGPAMHRLIMNSRFHRSFITGKFIAFLSLASLFEAAALCTGQLV